MNNAIEEVSADESNNLFTAESFLAYLRPSHPRWWDSKWDSQPGWIFRGVAKHDYPLLPSGLRELKYNKTRKHLFDRVHDEINKQQHLPQEYQEDPDRFIWNHFIIEGVASFCREVKLFGYPIETVHYLEKSIFSDNVFNHLRSKAHEWHHHQNWINAWALAQHHGIPTFLLDWTRHPFFAAFFACDSWNPKERKDGEDIAIWALHWKNWEKFFKDMSQNTLMNAFHNCGIIAPSMFGNDYMKSQMGVFTWVAGKYDKNNQKWLGADEIIQQFERSESYPVFLKKIILKGEQVPKLKTLIYREGISKANLMPILDNIAHTVKSRWIITAE